MLRRLRALPLLAILLVPLAATQLPPVRAAILALVDHMRTGGHEGVALYAGAYAFASVLTAPIALFSGLAGYAYGPVRGLLVASPVNVLAATTAFLVGRFLVAGPVARWTAGSPRWAAIHRAVSADAFRIAVLLRLTPLVPQNFLSYGLALTGVRVRTFMAATWLGLLPITCFHVYVGSLVRDATELLDGKRPPMGPWGWAATVAGLVLTAGGMVLTAKLSRRALARSGV